MSRRSKRWGITLFIAIVIMVPVAIVLAHWMNGSNTGNVHVGSPADQNTPPAQPIPVKTTYFTTELPAGFSVKRQTETPSAAQILLQLEANTHATQDEQFAATVGNVPTDGFSGIGDYNLRAKDTAFRNVSGAPSFVVFWPHGSHYVEIALSTDGGANLAQLQTIFTGVMAQWQWQ